MRHPFQLGTMTWHADWQSAERGVCCQINVLIKGLNWAGKCDQIMDAQSDFLYFPNTSQKADLLRDPPFEEEDACKFSLALKQRRRLRSLVGYMATVRNWRPDFPWLAVTRVKVQAGQGVFTYSGDPDDPDYARVSSWWSDGIGS
jgi:hypothetical protein